MAGKQEPDEEMYLLTDGPPKLSEIISNLGIVCVNSSTFLWRVLNQFGITPENRAGVFTPVDVYRVMQEIFAPSGLRSSNPEYTEKFNAVLSQGNLGLVISADSYGEKEAKVLADAINEAAPGFDWGELFAHVEKISTPQMGKKAGKFFGFFLKTAFEENLSRFPTQHLYTKWSDRGFQFHTIKTIIEDAPELIINTSEDHRPVIQPKVMSSIPLHVANSLRNSPFNSLDLIEALIVFSQDSLYPEVKELMEQGIRQRPELILLGLTESEIPWNALYRELAPGLVLLFVRGHPSSSYVLPILWQTNKTLVTTGLMHLYSKSTAYMPRILEVSQEIKALSELLDMRSCTFGINLALAASSANLLDVNKWLQTRLSAEGRDFLASCISFLEEELSHELEKEQPGVKIQAVPKDVQATMPMATSQMTGVNNHEKTGNKYTHVLPENSNNSPLLTSAIISKLLNFLISNCSLMPPEIHSSFKSFNLKLVTAYPEFTNMVSSLLPEEKSEPASSDSGTSINDSEITSKSISYFEELYRGDLSLKQVVELFQNLYSSTSKAEKVTYECMVRYLLNEYKFLDCYPDKQLLTTAALYGYLINLQLLDPHTLPVALKHVLDALKHRSDSPHFRFGFCALSLFDQKLPEWRQYSEQLLHISSLQQFAPDLILFIKNFLQSSENKRDLSPKDQTIDRRPDAKDVRAIYPSSATKTSPDATLPDSTVSRKPGSSKPKTPTPEDRKDQTIQSPLPENVHNAVLFIINNLSSTNVVEKAEQIKKYLDDQTKAWLSYYIVSNRVCFEPNFSDLYVSFISHINDKKLDGYIITSTYKVIYDIIGVNKVEYTFQERHALKNLGIWLGHISLTKNKPIKHKHLSFKDLLITSYNIKTLPAIIPFVCKVFERATQDSVFFPPNPWTMSVLKMLAELYYYSQMRTNLKLQIDILFKNLNLEISEIERSDIFRALQKKKDTEAVAICSRAVERPLLQTSDDVCHTAQQNLSGGNEPLQPIDNVVFNTGRDYGMPYSRKKSLNTSSGSPIEEKPWNTQYGVSSRGTSASGMKSIDNPYFLKRIVQMGVESAIREVINAVVERSVTIAGIATRELIVKDFNSDNFEDRMTRASHMMASALAGSLASVSSREPLRLSIMAHVRVLLSLNGYVDQPILDQIMHQMVSDCLDYACGIMESAASERAIYEADEAVSSILARRKQQRQAGSKVYNNLKCEASNPGINLPPMLRLKPEGITALQWKAYEDFARLNRVSGAAAQSGMYPHLMHENELSKDAPKEVAHDTSRIVDTGYHVLPHAPSSQQVLGQILGEFMKYANELEKHVVEKSTMPGGKGVSTDEIVNIFRGMQYLVMASHRADVCIFFTQKILQLLYKHHHRQMAQEVFVSFLAWFCRVSAKCASELSEWFLYRDDDRKYNPTVALCMLEACLLNPVELDAQMSRMIMCGSQPAIKFSVEVLYLFLTRASPSGMYSTFSQTFDALLKLHARKEAPPRFESVLEMNNERAFTLPLKKPILKGDSELMDIHSGMAQIFMNWIAIYYHPYSNETSHKYFIESLYSNIPPSGINIMSLFTSCAHLSIDSEKFLRFSPAEFSHLSNYQIVDAYARLIVLLIRYDYFKQCKMPPHQYNIDLFTNALASVVMSASSIHKLEEARFKQRPILRLFSSLLNDLATFTENLPIYPSLLATISDILCCTEPSLLPALTFAWIQVISHRNFMPRILSVKEQWNYYHALLVHLFGTMSTFFGLQGMNEKTKYIYKAAVNITTALLNDFPEFLCGYHISLVSCIPHSFIYLRNLILSASPRGIQFPDPFTPNLKIDLLPEIGQLPQILSDYVSKLSMIGILEELDIYLNTRTPLIFLTMLKKRLMYKTPSGKTVYNIHAINSLVLYVGVKAVSQMQRVLPQNSIPFAHGPTLDIYQQLITDLDAEGRYYLLNALADQLRYPNRHTHYFSCVILYLFAEATQELIQEQITRVLVERAMVSKPHPYGLLITYVELIRNKRYKFWEHKSFLTCSPDIEGMFLAVKKSINQLLVRAT